jgi:WD40 repeat protein
VPLGGDKPEVWVFDTVTAQVKKKLTGTTGRALRSAFTPDGRLVTAHCFQMETIVWDLDTGTPARVLPFYGDECVSVAVRPGGKQVAVGGTGGVLVYDLGGTGTEARALTLPGTIHGLAYSPTGGLLAAAATDGRFVRVYDADTGAEVRTLDTPDAGFGVAFAPDGRRLAAGGHRFLRVWDTGNWTEVLARNDLPGAWVAFGPNPDVLWAGPWSVTDSNTSRPRRLDLRTGVVVELATPPSPYWPSFALSPDGKALFVADTNNGVWVCDPATGEPKVVPQKAP